MKNRFTARIKNYFKIKKNRIDRKLLVYLICVLIASVFWFLNAMSKDYNATVTLPVRFVNPPQNKILVGKMPDKLNLKVNGYGFSLLRYKLKLSFYPITFNISELTGSSQKNSGSSIIKIRTSSFLSQIGAQLSSDIKLQSIEPEDLYFRFEPVKYKKVPVVPSCKISYEKQYEEYGKPVVNPAYVLVKGPASMINSLKYLTTEPKEFKKVNRSIQFDAKLNLRDNLSCELKNVNVYIPVEQVTETRLNVPIQIKNLPEGFDLKTFPSHILVTCVVPLSQFQKVDPDDFAAMVDYNMIELNKDSKKLAVTFDHVPTNISNFTFNPHEVEYLIEKK
ncbi:MAG: hypothetical protein Q8862_09715 [Bacteroidota bacterium]|nr:hypothetical protein [Bacteroidota bacterium]